MEREPTFIPKYIQQIFCTELRPFISRRDTVLRDCINVEERVAITIWKLATNIEYRALSELFAFGKSTVCKIVNDTCQQIVINLLPKYVKISKGERLKEVLDGFETTKGFPQAVGAIDGIVCPNSVFGLLLLVQENMHRFL